MNVHSLNFNYNVNFKSRATEPINKSAKNGTSYKAYNVLNTQLQRNKPSGNVKYLDYNLNKKEIIKALDDTKKMGRTFFGYKRSIANMIVKSKDNKLAVDNFNILMNAKNKELKACDIACILFISTTINNNEGKQSEIYAKEYGFKGGLLDDKSIDFILKKIIETRQVNEIQAQIMRDQLMQAQMLQDQMMRDQMLQDQLMQNQMMQNQMMMTPGFF